MKDSTTDSKIADMYARGHLTNEIADAVGLRLAEVIGRVRAMNLQPPGMGVRLSRSAQGSEQNTQPEPLPSHKSISNPVELQEERLPLVRRTLASLPATLPKRQPALRAKESTKLVRPSLAPDLEDDFEDDDEQSRRAGVPKGWLVTEEEFHKAFSKAQFETLIFKPVPQRRLL